MVSAGILGLVWSAKQKDRDSPAIAIVETWIPLLSTAERSLKLLVRAFSMVLGSLEWNCGAVPKMVS
jgi:hypothetical protein